MIRTVDASQAGSRLDVFLHDHILCSLSRESVIRLIKNQVVSVNKKKAKAGYRICAGDVIEIGKIEYETSGILPQDIPVDILYEDNDILIVNKARGMVVHPGSGNRSGTLVNALAHHAGGGLSTVNGSIRPGVVHRIDKDTSGLLVVAKNDRAHEVLARQFKEHSITREYLAVCEGILEYNRVRIDRPISRSRSDRKKMDVTAEGRKAISDITVIERFSNATYVSIRLETGRTHQIRVHLKSIGHPLVGDIKYGRKNSLIAGQALHAARLGFVHPSTGEYIEFYINPPKDFCDLIDFLKSL